MAIYGYVESATLFLDRLAIPVAASEFFVAKSQPVAQGTEPTGERWFGAIKHLSTGNYDYAYVLWNLEDGFHDGNQQADVDLSEVTDLMEDFALAGAFFGICEESDYDGMIEFMGF